MCKLQTGIIANNVFEYLDEHHFLPNDQKGCRHNSRCTKDQLLIDKTILKNRKMECKNLALAWVDYKRAFGMAPYSWIVECLHLVNVSKNIINSIKTSMKSWRTELN